MERMKFSKLSLLSNKERRGLQIDLSAPATVLVAGNGFGKSAILKSLYDALGAKPHKLDDDWRGAAVTSLLEFSIGTTQYAALKSSDTYTILDHDKSVLLSTQHVTSVLGPYLGEICSFRLVLANKKDETKVPPPSYIFSPYYVDQDASWQNPWRSFVDLTMFPNSPKALSEYHSGLRPNAFYEAKAQRDRLKAEFNKIDAERKAVDQAYRRIGDTMTGAVISIDLDEFKNEAESLVRESQALHDAQTRYRNELATINEEYHLWLEHVGVVEAALRETDDSFKQALVEAPEVDCPMCGQHYENHVADQFELVADKDELLHALQIGRQKVRELTDTRNHHKNRLDEVVDAIDRVNGILAVHRRDISLRDVVTAQGKSEARRALSERLAELDAEAGEKQRLIADAEERMRETESKHRRLEILTYFADTLGKFTSELDVNMPTSKRDVIQGAKFGRGSEGPRGLAAYYYAFLQTAGQYGSSAFCPIVIDAPNQQGQDKGHLDQIIRFLLTRAPANAQIIIGTEAISDHQGANVIDVTHKKKQVLREDRYDEVADYVRPFLTQSIL
jgi:hypothetical protein